MPQRERPEIVNFCASYQRQVDARVRTLTRSFLWTPSTSLYSRNVGARNVPMSGMAVAAFNRLHDETGQEYDDVAIRGALRYCRIEAAQRAQMKLIVSGKDNFDVTVYNIDGTSPDVPEGIPIASPEDSVLVQLNEMLGDSLVEEARDLELGALAAGRNLGTQGVDIWSVDMTAHAEAAVLNAVDRTEHTGNWTIDRAVQIYYMLHMFEQVAEVALSDANNFRIPLSEIDRIYG